MFDGNDDAKRDDGRVAVPSGSVRRRRWSAAEEAAVVRETLLPGARFCEVARRWQVDAQQVYRWRHNEGVTQRRTMHGGHAAVRWYHKFGQWLKLGSLLRRTDLDDEQTEAVFGGVQGEGCA